MRLLACIGNDVSFSRVQLILNFDTETSPQESRRFNDRECPNLLSIYPVQRNSPLVGGHRNDLEISLDTLTRPHLCIGDPCTQYVVFQTSWSLYPGLLPMHETRNPACASLPCLLMTGILCTSSFIFNGKASWAQSISQPQENQLSGFRLQSPR